MPIESVYLVSILKGDSFHGLESYQHRPVMALEDFDDDPSRCGEKILEAIQMAWIEELD